MPAARSSEELCRDREVLLKVTEELIYARGIQSVGMDEIRSSSGLTLKRIYAQFATKEDLVVATLQRRDLRWRNALAAHVNQYETARGKLLAMFDWLDDWFAEPGFRGCLWINVHGELGATSPAIAAEVRAHKHAFHDQITMWATEYGPAIAEAVYLLAEGAIVTAGIADRSGSARHARTAVEAIIM
ncbi:TetR/AcrR family transcriptional regulator [Gordonia sp. DT101]|uniref:TetR/AcrR family transcriptional regulator n=1 Tax=Gordonia sp. DT101 TaxID=3416545 RepID=UPI003CF83AC6